MSRLRRSKLKIELHEGALITLSHEHPTALAIRAQKRWQERGSSENCPPGGHQPDRAPLKAAQLPALRAEILVTPKGLERDHASDAQEPDVTADSTQTTDSATKSDARSR